MRRQLLIFSLLIALIVATIPAFAGNVTERNNASVNATVSAAINATNSTINATENTIPTNKNLTTALNSTIGQNQQNQTLNKTRGNTSGNETKKVSLEELVKMLQSQLEELKKQNEILREENRKLRQQVANLTKRIEELERKPITWKDVEEKVDEYYVQFTYWTGWMWPLLTFYLIYRYRKPAIEVEEERIQEAVEKLTKEKQREWYSFQIRKQGIEAVAEDETELAIFRALGIHTVGDLLDKSEQEIVEAFKAKYHPTADIEEHFRGRLKEIKEKLKEAKKGG